MGFRETASFVLNFVDDNLALMRNAGLSISPTMTLGKERVSAIQLSGVVLIVLITLFVRGHFDSKIDVLAWTVVSAVYLSVVSFLVYGMVRRFQQATLESDARDVRLDTNSYVLFFNAVALFIFALLQEFLLDTLFRDHNSLNSPTVPAALVAALAAGLIISRANKNIPANGSGLTLPQRRFIVGVLVATFFAYVRIVTWQWQ